MYGYTLGEPIIGARSVCVSVCEFDPVGLGIGVHNGPLIVAVRLPVLEVEDG